MRKLGIGLPHNFKIVNDGSKEEGPIYAKPQVGSPEYSVHLERLGGEFSKVGDSLTISNDRGGNLGDFPFEFGEQEVSSLSQFFKPFRVKYSYDSENGLYDYISQSDDSVIDFATMSLPRPITHYKDLRTFSFAGNLYLLAHTHREGDPTFGLVHLLKYSEESKNFNTVKVFYEEPVDTEAWASSLSGSPDYFVYDGMLSVAYRRLNRETGREEVVVFRWENPLDFNSWVLVNRIEISKLNYSEDGQISNNSIKFRLRAAEGDGAVMIVIFSVYTVLNLNYNPSSSASSLSISQVPRLSVRDARSFVSYDGFENYITAQKDLAGIAVATSSQEVNDGTYANLFNFFDISYFAGFDTLPEEERESYPAYLEATSTLETVNFDLYYDTNMGSFVIMKQADKEGTDWAVWKHPSIEGEEYSASQHLIAIKTVDSDYQNWDRCLVYPLDNRGVPERGRNVGAHRILDISIVPSKYKNKIFISTVFKQDSITAFSSDEIYSNYVYHSDFSFIPNHLIKKRTYGEGLAIQYGTKTHPDWAFYFEGLLEENSVVSSGSQYRRGDLPEYLKNLNFTEISACKYREQYICITDASQKFDGRDNYFMAISSPLSNIAEYQGYDYNYPSMFRSLLDFGWEPQSFGLSSYSWDPEGGGNTFSISSSVSQRYLRVPLSWWSSLQISNNLTGEERRIDYTFSKLKSSAYFKIKLDMYLESHSSFPVGQNFTFLNFSKVGLLSTLNFSLRMRSVAPGLASIDVYSNGLNGFNQYVLSLENDIDVTKRQSFIFSGCKFYDSDGNIENSVVVWRRSSEETKWSFVGYFFYSDVNINTPPTPEFSLGLINVSFPVFNFKLKIGDVHVASNILSPLGEGLDSVSYYYYQDNQRVSGLRGRASSKVREIELLDNKLELSNGSLIYLNQVSYGREFLINNRPYRTGISSAENTFILTRSSGSNNLSNVTNDFADLGYEFTEVSEDGVFELVLSNENYKSFDSFHLFNVCGFQRFEVFFGDYTEELFNQEKVSYSLPYKELEVKSQDGYYMVVSEIFADGSLKGYNFYIYDNQDDKYEDQLFVVNNFNDVIQLDTFIPNLSGKTVRMFLNSASFMVPENISEGVYPNVGFRFYTEGGLNLGNIGEIVITSFKDISEYVSSYSDSFQDSRSIVQSEKGLIFPSKAGAAPVRELATLELKNIDYNHNFIEVMNSMVRLGKESKNFPVIVSTSEGIYSQFAALNSGFNTSWENYRKVLSTSLSIQNWTTRRKNDFFIYPPILEAYSTPARALVGQDVVFLALVQDPQGQQVTVEWEIQGLVSSGTTATQSFQTSGRFLVKVSAVNESGLSTTRFIELLVELPSIEYYEATYSSPIFANVPFEILIESKDSGGNVAVYDSSTILTFQETSSTDHLRLDLDRDGVYTKNPLDFEGRLEEGRLNVPIVSISNGFKELTFSDNFGKSLSIPLEFLSSEIYASSNLETIFTASALGQKDIEPTGILATESDEPLGTELDQFLGVERSVYVNLSSGFEVLSSGSIAVIGATTSGSLSEFEISANGQKGLHANISLQSEFNELSQGRADVNASSNISSEFLSSLNSVKQLSSNLEIASEFLVLLEGQKGYTSGSDLDIVFDSDIESVRGLSSQISQSSEFNSVLNSTTGTVGTIDSSAAFQSEASGVLGNIYPHFLMEDGTRLLLEDGRIIYSEDADTSDS